MHRINVR